MAFEDIRNSRKWLSAQDVGFIIFALIAFVALLSINIYVARLLPGGEQFYLRWEGARAFLNERVEPYSEAVAERTQVIAYGRSAFSSEYPYFLNDPFYIVMMYIPLAGLSDLIALITRGEVEFSVIRGFWLLISEASLIGLVYSFIRSLEWTPPRGLYILLFVSAFAGYYNLLALGSGSPSVLMVFLFFAILYSLRSFFDELAGALLFLITYQWEISALFFLFVVVFVLGNRRWRVLYGFSMSLVIIAVLSFLIYPGWPVPYFRGVLADWQHGTHSTFFYIAQTWFPDARFTVGFWVSLLLGIALFLEWLGAVDAHYRRVVWVACLSIALTPLMGFVIFPSNHVVLFPAFLLIVMLAWERWSRRHWAIIFLILLSLLVPFWLYVRVIGEYLPLLSDILTVLPPFAAVLGLYWMRWWAFRSPRTWFDQVGGLS